VKTINVHFNQAWEHLAEIHPAFPSVLWKDTRESLDLTEKPKLNKEEWKTYISKFIIVVDIGRRNGYLGFHVDGKGRIIYLYVLKDIAEGKVKYPKEERIKEERISESGLGVGGAARKGKPKTEEERKEEHIRRYGTKKLPPRGTGLKKQE